MVLYKASSFLDSLVVFNLCFLAAIPFHQVLHIEIGFAILNLGELLLLLLLLIFITTLASRGFVKKYAPYVLFVFTIFALYLVFSLLLLDVGFGRIINQVRHFLPFIVACTALLSRLHINKVDFARKISYMVALSGFVAIIIHLFFKGFLAYAFAANEEVSAIILEGGRMYWGSATLAFFALAAFLMESKQNKRIALALVIVIILLASLFTQTRTMLIGLLLFYVSVELIVSKKPVRAVLKISTLAVIASSLFFLFASGEIMSLLQKRLLLGTNIQSELAHSFGGRFDLYAQYINILEATFPFGQGLGVPYTINRFSESFVYTTDISLLTFVLPFGVCGLFIFLGFIVNILESFKTYSKYNFVDKSGKIFFWLTVIALIVSLNLDLFSRNIFVVYLAVFVVLHDTARKSKAVKTGTAYNCIHLRRCTQNGPTVSHSKK